jgi:hypothetical protein
MENVRSSLGFGATESDQKAVLMNQVRHEAAIQNVRQLVEVRALDFKTFLDSCLYMFRKSMGIASRNAFRSQALPCLGLNRPAFRSAWRNTWLHGILLASNTFRGYNRRRVEGQVVEVCFDCGAAGRRVMIVSALANRV